jgi:large subunit ribosomal protein L6
MKFRSEVAVELTDGEVTVKRHADDKLSLALHGTTRALIANPAEIRAVRKPEPYKGKGIRYEGEYVRRKAGKAGAVGQTK